MDLKKQFEEMTITQLEKEIKSKIETSGEARRDATFILYYLKASGRFKENPLYSKSSFKTYLEDVHSIREGTFNENVMAYTKYPKEAVSLGVGLVSSIQRKCGATKTKKVLNEINIKKKSLKTPIKRAQIATIISSHAKPVPPKQPGYKALYDEELRLHQITKTRYDAAMAELKVAREQIEKLKATVLKLKRFKDILDTVNEEIEEPLIA